MITRNLEKILSQVERPSRYIGGEVNSVKKDPSRCDVTVALAFPDAYEVGMSHLGLQILYAILNNESFIAAERFFAPWPDMEQKMREAGIPLYSMESRTPLNRFDLVGFSLQYELSYTNVITMLDLGRIPIFARDRSETDPIVIAGGPCVFNPEPVSMFFDAFAIGEGEEVILEISRAFVEGKNKKLARNDLLALLSSIEGVYVPSIHRSGETITKRIVADMDRWTLPCMPIVPLVKTIHDRVTLEIARGCSRGCRFCQAGMVWRPTRERSPGILKNMAETMLSSTGHNELSLLSLSSGDYSHIEHLLTLLMNRYYERKIALALPSMRVETLTEPVIEQIKRVRKTSFTLAPEAGTQRLRNVINKGNTEENLLDTARRVFDAGWKSVKLYFMLGLPTETDDDLEGIVDLAYKVLREGGKKRQVTISLSTFVPKSHTPFQWHRQIDLNEINVKQDYLKKNVRHRNLNLRWHDARMSLLEGLLSRADKNIGTVIARAFELGCRFDGWGDKLQFHLWDQAIRESNVSIDDYLKERNVEGSLPWDHIDCGISKDFLTSEYRKSLNGTLTEDCRFGKCHKCGVCNKEYKIILAENTADDAATVDGNMGAGVDHQVGDKKFRIKFSKLGEARLLSHLETSSALIRSITRAGLTFVFSEGFHPHPRISFGHASPVGTESTCEYADIQLRELPATVEGVIQSFNASLPSGLEIVDIQELPPRAEALSSVIAGYRYRMYLPKDMMDQTESNIEETIQNFIRCEEFIVTKERKGKSTRKNIRPLVDSIVFESDDYVIEMTSRAGTNGGVSPWEILKNVIGLPHNAARTTRIIKTASIFRQDR